MRCPTMSQLSPSSPKAKDDWPWKEETHQLPDLMSDSPCWPKVSIITPSYNQGQFIEETILSVKNQDYTNIEHIIVDGGSKDNTLNILQKYEGTYNMCWTSTPDRGQSDAINKGFRMVNGEIVGWLNSDDVYFSKDLIKEVVEIFLSRGDLDLIYGDCVVINSNSLIVWIGCGIPISYEILLKRNFIAQPTVFLRKKIIKKYKLDVKLDYAMDYEFWLRISKEFKFYYLNKIMAGMRIHRDCKTVFKVAEMKREETFVKEKYYNAGLKSQFLTFLVKLIQCYLRVKGLKKVFELYLMRNYAFPVKIDNKLRFCFRQIFRFIFKKT